MHFRHRVLTALIVAGCLGGGLLQADVRLPQILSAHMVLQREQPVRIWGWAEAGERVTVDFAGQRASTDANAEGKWQVFLNPMPAGGPYDMTVEGRNKIVLRDVLLGEVWIGSGQSNMVWPVGRSDNAEKEISSADFPRLRLFKVKLLVSGEPLEDVEGSWQAATSESVADFSAIGYFFGRELHREMGVPFGIIQTAWGGTPAQSWTSREALAADPALQRVFDDWAQVLSAYPAAKEKHQAELKQWEQQAAKTASGAGSAAPWPHAPMGPEHPHSPAGLYNAMIAPLTPFAIRGALWYQGESDGDSARGYLYRDLFPAMIEDWRRAWARGPFPFLFVQLANFRPVPEKSEWPELREAQQMTLDLRNTGMAVTIDIGESEDIHPTNKQDVGHRLALAARAVAYGREVVHSGPVYRQMTIEGSGARLWFDSVGGGLTAHGGELKDFVIAGPDRQFHAAQARIEGDTIVVSSAKVKTPLAVRYAWHADPKGNLFNRSELPASPFRTDDWRSAMMPE
ncbi:MAG TPA: sialate O-acetylesterase [Bryobacterales bacterium]|nr:sialate O-acetylesterase [Bryobacterales bacterium]